MKIKKLLCIGVLLLSCVSLHSQIIISENKIQSTSFPIYTNQSKTTILVDASDYESVKKCAALFAEDIGRVTGVDGLVSFGLKNTKGHSLVLVGTIGKSRYIDSLVKEGKLDVASIDGKWESFIIKVVKNPMKGVDRALVIAGSDRRGTSYGIFTVSEAMGVSPLYWWADVPVKKKRSIYLDTEEYVSLSPSVKYRGIFINDEGWGITPWAGKTYDKELGDIGPKTYARVCELILRMKGNMLAPAMHPSSGAFNKYPENKKVADSYGIVMSSSHCEPLLFNNVTEWHKDIHGEWNYMTNKQGIIDVLDKRISENSAYENVYTIAMRGIHDSGLVGVPKDKEVELVEEVIQDQRGILSKYIDAPIDSIPQIFVPYKEVLDIYERGLKLPEDITLVWPDDNFGYIKKLNTKKESERKGGSGVYYHISYLGEPHDYLWLNTTPPALMYEEMSKAYATGAKTYWLLNVGDIKPGELGIKTFLDIAWNCEGFNYDNINTHQIDFLVSVFGERYRRDLSDIMSTYYKLGFQRKPESMGWGYEWNNEHSQERMTDTDFSFTNYCEAEKRMAEYERISNMAESIWKSLPEEYQACFYELVFYPVKGATLMNKKMLTAQQNRWFARQGRSMTNDYARKAQAYHDSIGYYTKLYNEQLNGKWNHMMSLAPGWVATYQNMPLTETIELPDEGKLCIQLPNQDLTFGAVNSLPVLNSYTKKDTYIDLYNKGKNEVKWSTKTSDKWILLSTEKGTLRDYQRIKVSVDWAEVPIGEKVSGTIKIIGSQSEEVILLTVMNPASPSINEVKDMYLEENGCVVINPGRYHRKYDNKDVKIQFINGLGYEGQCVQLGNPLAPAQDTYRTNTTARVEYDFYSFNAGSVTVYTYAIPTFPLYSGCSTRFGVMIDDGVIKFASNDAKEYSSDWKENVARNSSINAIRLTVDKPGKHTLKLICKDPGVIIQKVVVDFGGMKRSYLGPEVTFIK